MEPSNDKPFHAVTAVIPGGSSPNGGGLENQTPAAPGRSKRGRSNGRRPPFAWLRASGLGNPASGTSPSRNRFWVHGLLFGLTVASTFLVGLGDGLAGALFYSGGIMSILLAHEMGHYLTARKYGIPATLPYFIPMPFSPFGTMGAVIRMGGTIPDRRALMDVGAAGPLAGLALIVPLTAAGLALSKTVPVSSLGENTISLGDSLLFSGLARLVSGPLPEGHDILLHPLAFAGWVGLLVTALNLLPIGQLDGGHISYALFRRKSRVVSWAFYGILLGVCLFLYMGWALLAVILALIRRHPPTWDDDLPLDRKRLVMGWASLAVLLVSFTPVPFGFGEGLIPMLMKALK